MTVKFTDVLNEVEYLHLYVVKSNPCALIWIKDPSLLVIETALKENSNLLKVHQFQNTRIQLIAVQLAWMNVRYINSPSERVQMAAVLENFTALMYIKNPTEAVQLTAVTSGRYAISYIHSPSIKIQLAAVQKDGLAIKYIHKPSKAVRAAALQQNSKALDYAPPQWVPYAFKVFKNLCIMFWCPCCTCYVLSHLEED